MADIQTISLNEVPAVLQSGDLPDSQYMKAVSVLRDEGFWKKWAIGSLFGSQIIELEGIKKDGETVFLDLRPADPRALLLGDYMALRYTEENGQEIYRKRFRRLDNSF